MTFLDPSAAITAAAVGVPILLVLYLLKLRRRPVRVGSILFWPRAQEDVQANVPLRMLRPSWLLLLHLLILASFVLALGRPVLTEGVPPAQRVILLLDTSASMSAIDAGEKDSRLERAKAKALELVDKLRHAGGRREVCLVTFAADARAVTGFTTSAPLIADALGAVLPTDQPGSLAAALKLVDALSASDEEEAEGHEPPTAVLLSDGSFKDQGKLPPSATRLRFERIGPAGAELEGASGEPSSPDNLGIVGFSARRDAQDPGTVRIFADILNTNAAAVAAPVTLSINGVVVERRAIEIPAAGTLGPGRAATTFELKNNEGGVVLATISRQDALASDNAAGLVLPPAQRPSILLVEPDAATTAAPQSLTGASWILEDVLAELHARNVSTISASEYERRAAGGLLGSADLVIYDRVAPKSLPPVPTISFGAVPPLPGVTAGPPAGSTNILFWLRSHPIMRNVALDAVIVAQSTPLQSPPDAPDVTELMRGRDGPLLILFQQGESGVRRLIAGFDLAMSNWPLQAGFPIFLADAVDYLTLRADAAAGRSFKTDQPVEVRVKPGSSGRVALRGPIDVVLRAGGAAAGAAGDAGGVGVVTAGMLPRAGVYIVEGDAALDRAVAVNLADDLESSLNSPATVQVAGKPVEGVTGVAAPREVWTWFVLAAIGLLAVEWLVYGRSVRA